MEGARGARPCLVAQAEGEERSFPFDRLLLAVGRMGNTDALGAARAGLVVEDRGFLRVDDRLETSRRGIFAAGDCTTLPELVYVAAKAGTLAAENALGGDRRLDLSAMPAVVFTDPRLAWVGLNEEEARVRGLAVRTSTLTLEHVPRALVNRDTRGRMKVVATMEDGRILGVHVLSPHAGEVIQTGVLAVRHGLTVGDLVDTLFPYLTEVEGLRLVCQAFSRSVEGLSCCAGSPLRWRRAYDSKSMEERNDARHRIRSRTLDRAPGACAPRFSTDERRLARALYREPILGSRLTNRRGLSSDEGGPA